VAARVETHLNYQSVIRQLNNVNRIDGLTGINNRRSFDERLSLEFKRSCRERYPLTVAMIDIDEFKKFNDYFGHLKGDDCLKGCASALHDSAARPADFVARYGGEEFALILPDTDSDGAQKILSRILHSVKLLNFTQAPNAVHDVVTVSIGYSTFIPTQANLNDVDEFKLLNAADKALYVSKNNGRNQQSC
jgi:diguanylate cyclase (GGDEF)-like protein